MEQNPIIIIILYILFLGIFILFWALVIKTILKILKGQNNDKK